MVLLARASCRATPFAACAGVALVAAHSAGAAPIAAAPASCASMHSPYDYTRAAASTCFVTDPLVRVTPLPGGGQQYTYRQANGNLVSEPLPPAGFDPATASDAQLAEYALPPKPTLLPELSAWQEEMKQAWFATPPPFLAELPAAEQTGPPSAPLSAAAAPAGVGWAGYMTDGSQRFSFASAAYKEPAVGATGCPAPIGFAAWAGIGSTVGVFAQDGTETDTGFPADIGWAQIWNNNVEQMNIFLMAVPAGDGVRANVNWETGEVFGTLTNTTTGQVQPWSMAQAGSEPDSAEALVEKQDGFNLANFGTLTFTGSHADDINTSLGDFNPSLSNINVGTAKATTSSPIGANGGFVVNQTHC